MLNSEQRLMLYKARRTPNSLFNALTKDIIREISEFGQDPNSDFFKALHMTAYGELDALKAMLDAASHSNKEQTKLKELLLSTGTTVTPAGLTAKHKTLLECAIEAGDPGMVALLKAYFPKFTGGEEEMERQCEPYRPIIKAIRNQTADDLTWLFEIIKASSLDDVSAELATGENYDPSYKSTLRTAMNKFRTDKLDPKNRTITKPRMHCNYQNLMHAHRLLDVEWENLKDGNNHQKHYLIAKQIIGFIHLCELPAIDRFTLARGKIKESAAGKEIERRFDYQHGEGLFPHFDKRLMDSRSGVGYDFYISVFGPRLSTSAGLWDGGGGSASILLSNHISTKIFKLAGLVSPSPRQKPPMCVIV